MRKDSEFTAEVRATCIRCGNTFTAEGVYLFGKLQPIKWCDQCLESIENEGTKGEAESESSFQKQWWELNVPNVNPASISHRTLPRPATVWLENFRSSFSGVDADPRKGLIILDQAKDSGRGLLLQLLHASPFDLGLPCAYWRISDPTHKVHFYLDGVLKGDALKDHLSSRYLLAIDGLGEKVISKELGQDLLDVIEMRHNGPQATILTTSLSSQELVSQFEDQDQGAIVVRRLSLDCQLYRTDLPPKQARLFNGCDW